MAWVETSSDCFLARHDAVDAHHAADLLNDLEGFRGELSERFDPLPCGVSVIVHPRSVALSLAQPWLPLARIAADQASRRYMAGWFSRGELHVLSPRALERRASGVEGSMEALLLSPLHEYAHLVIGAANARFPPPFTPASFRRYLRWAWLCEGAATHLAGQTPYLRAAIARRLSDGPSPAFPPAPRDAPLLGGTVFMLLDQARGADACATLAHSRAATAHGAIEQSFRLPFVSVEHDWRALLRRLAAPNAPRRESARADW